MVEEHVGKKRRKEVRQAITMSEELRKTLLLCIGLIVFGIIVLLVLFVISYLGLFEIPLVVTNTVPLVILVVLMIFVAPKANRYWALRDEYKAHLERYNISKDDMRALNRTNPVVAGKCRIMAPVCRKHVYRRYGHALPLESSWSF